MTGLGLRDRLRQQVLEFGLIGCVDLSYIHRMVEDQMPGADSSALQQATIETIRSLAEDGLVETGYPENGEFVHESLDLFLQEVHAMYVVQYDEPSAWFQQLFVNLTDKGVAVAMSTSEGRRIAEYERQRLQSIDDPTRR
ncbi:hypothetical protein [Mycolicibacterium vaccae]|uniref:hypothetical protein n=1 Tax=Mycolicibacterium vaccae TaxID=1810 RepID=UPI003CFDDD2D